MWEIATLGAMPYHAHANGEIARLLQSGYRMPPPEGCPEDFYQVRLLKCVLLYFKGLIVHF
jgi:hypothetical protein